MQAAGGRAARRLSCGHAGCVSSGTQMGKALGASTAHRDGFMLLTVRPPVFISALQAGKGQTDRATKEKRKGRILGVNNGPVTCESPRADFYHIPLHTRHISNAR